MVSQTVGDLIQAAAEELLVVDSGGSLTTNEQNSAVDRLQRLIDSSGAQRPLIFGERIDLLTLTANQQKYTIGIDPTNTHTAQFNVPWPSKIERANLLLSTTVRRPMDILDAKGWARIRYQTVYGPPQAIYFDRNMGTNGGSLSGFGSVYFYMIPDQAYQWELYSWQQNPSIASTADLLNYPPGYADFWLYSMVVRMASMFGRTPTPAHVQLLADAKAVVASMNCPSPELVRGDAAMLGEGGDMYNWLTGQTEYR